ncbi:MAG: aldo/keto reductase [Planctomycetota bacterium]
MDAPAYRRLGQTGLLVHPCCLGTMNFDSELVRDEDAFGIMETALDLGLNFFDTADVYGKPTYQGRTEEVIGEWLSQGKARRDRIVLATKVFGTVVRSGGKGAIGADFDEVNKDRGLLSAHKIIRGCEASLKRLKTDRIDLYQMHHIDRNCPVDEYWDAFDTLRKQGKIIYVGSSNFAGWDIATSNMFAQGRGIPGLRSEQSVYNLSNRMAELEVVPACQHFGMGLIPWSPLAGGLLAGALERVEGGRRASEQFRARVEANRAKLEPYESLAKQLGITPAQLGLAWLWHQPAVTSNIVGPRTVEQLTSAVDAASISLDDGVLRQLDELFPGPGGAAPNAYAW